MRKAAKIKWKEMNKKQRVLFVIEWILRGILAAIFVVMLGVGLATCVKTCNGERSDKVAYADAGIIARGGIVEVNFNNNLSTYPYLSYEGTAGTAGTFWVVCHNFPKTAFTVEVVHNISTSLSYQVILVKSDLSSIAFDFVDDHRSISMSDFPSDYSYVELRIFSSTVNVEFSDIFYFYGGSYVPGYGQGLAAGLQQGREEGASVAQYGIFQDASFDAVFTYDDDSAVTVNNLAPSYISNGIYFGKDLQSSYEVYNGSYLESALITINFKNPFSYSNQLPLRFSGSSDVLSFSLIDINNKRFSGDFLYAGADVPMTYVVGQGYVANTVGMSSIKSMQINFGRAADTFFGASISQIDGNYYGGYDSGYNAGYSDAFFEGYDEGYNFGFVTGDSEGYDRGYTTAYNAAYDVGYDVGHSDGYQEGFNQSKSGGFGWLISSVQQFLDVKFFGDFGIGTLLYVALGITLVSLFLKMFAGG